MACMKAFRTLVFSCLIIFASQSVFAQARICENLRNKLGDSKEEVITVIVEFKEPSASLELDELPNHVYYRMQKMRIMAEIYSQIHSKIIDYIYSTGDLEEAPTSLLLSNSLILRAKESLIREVINHNKEVISVHLNRRFHLSDFIRDYQSVYEDEQQQQPYTYGLERINIPKIASMLPEITGKNVVVGHIDTGINANHPDLVGKVIAFKDFVNNLPNPYDDNDHGTHTAGTIGGGWASGTRIGVAPEVKLVVAKVFDKNGYAKEDAILRAMEWMMDPDGDPQTNDGPVVVNNSWGGSLGEYEAEEPFIKAIYRWISLGIFPSFAAGNSGPNAYTIGAPGGYPHSFAVGATDSFDKVAYFSSRGPMQYWDQIINKPDVSAPGDMIYSSVSNGGWAKFSGTSMATPHVTGVVALLNQAYPDMPVDKVERLLVNTALDIDAENFDYNTGFGRIDAYRALAQVANSQLELPFP